MWVEEPDYGWKIHIGLVVDTGLDRAHKGGNGDGQAQVTLTYMLRVTFILCTHANTKNIEKC